jgi:hypothetical protein
MSMKNHLFTRIWSVITDLRVTLRANQFMKLVQHVLIVQMKLSVITIMVYVQNSPKIHFCLQHNLLYYMQFYNSRLRDSVTNYSVFNDASRECLTLAFEMQFSHSWSYNLMIF